MNKPIFPPLRKCFFSCKKKSMLLPFLLPLFLFSLFSSCEKKAAPKAAPSFFVSVDQVIKGEADKYIDTIGHVTPIISIDIKSRVEGELMEVYFKEGQEVKANDPLFLIDPKLYEASLQKAVAELEENQAKLKIAEDKLIRNRPLAQEEFISALTFDELQANVDETKAMINQNLADIEAAKINLEYCHINSPIDALTGILQITKGNLISQDGQNPLTTINQIAPIYVLFSIPEKYLPTLRKYQKINPLKVHVSFDNLDTDYIEGDLNLIDNQVDKNVGMIKLRGIFSNEERMLWPDQFVKTRLVLTTLKDVLLIEGQDVIYTMQGTKVFVVNEDNTVMQKTIELGPKKGSQVVVVKGLEEGEKIVQEGQLNLFDGAKVIVKKENK